MGVFWGWGFRKNNDQEVKDLKTKVDANTANINGITSKVNNLETSKTSKTEFNALSAKVETNSTNIVNLDRIANSKLSINGVSSLSFESRVYSDVTAAGVDMIRNFDWRKCVSITFWGSQNNNRQKPYLITTGDVTTRGMNQILNYSGQSWGVLRIVILYNGTIEWIGGEVG